jgi:hypothetical protein
MRVVAVAAPLAVAQSLAVSLVVLRGTKWAARGGGGGGERWEGGGGGGGGATKHPLLAPPPPPPPATVGGVVLGAIIGNEIERNQRTGGAAQYSVVRIRLENGQVLSLEQAANVDVRPGDRVRVYDRRGLARY